MKGEHNRDRAIEQLLRESRPETTASQPCVDAESLAGWSDGTLSPAEVRRIEGHASACDRCQSMLAAFARAEPERPAMAEPFWHRWRLQWLAPAAAMGTALAIWVAVPGDRPPSVTPTSAEVEERPILSGGRPRAEVDGTLDRTAPAGARTAPPPPDAQRRASDPATLRQRSQAGDQTGERERSSNAGGSLTKGPSESPSTRQQAERAVAKKGAVATAPITPPPAIGPPGDAAARVMSEPAAAGGAAGGAVQGALPPPVTVTPPPAPVSPSAASELGAVAPPRARFSRADAGSAPVPVDVVSPDAVHRWRIDAAGRLQHSSSNGATWQPVTLAVPDVLTAGTSPQGSVCWLVGRNGAVWVTADGLRFDRRAVPEPVDLISVGATDARRATVVAADRRTFVTGDGGVTWTAAAP